MRFFYWQAGSFSSHESHETFTTIFFLSETRHGRIGDLPIGWNGHFVAGLSAYHGQKSTIYEFFFKTFNMHCSVNICRLTSGLLNGPKLNQHSRFLCRQTPGCEDTSVWNMACLLFLFFFGGFSLSSQIPLMPFPLFQPRHQCVLKTAIALRWPRRFFEHCSVCVFAKCLSQCMHNFWTSF